MNDIARRAGAGVVCPAGPSPTAAGEVPAREGGRKQATAGARGGTRAERQAVGIGPGPREGDTGHEVLGTLAAILARCTT
ncbi:hypothetical protein R1flu_005680 [Riccia fluitans]|uniref:Uncharacterized protein n=1 Tax=Riccia fluitans TaxID=41844 RepID=A0ABD1YTU9_9MARC